MVLTGENQETGDYFSHTMLHKLQFYDIFGNNIVKQANTDVNNNADQISSIRFSNRTGKNTVNVAIVTQ